MNNSTHSKLVWGLPLVFKTKRVTTVIGSEAIRQTKIDGVKRTRIGLQLEGKRAAREGYAIYCDGQVIGEVTSGSFSPTRQHPIAMGYVNQLELPLGSALEVDVRGKMLPAITCKLPFYKRT